MFQIVTHRWRCLPTGTAACTACCSARASWRTWSDEECATSTSTASTTSWSRWPTPPSSDTASPMGRTAPPRYVAARHRVSAFVLSRVCRGRVASPRSEWVEDSLPFLGRERVQHGRNSRSHPYSCARFQGCGACNHALAKAVRSCLHTEPQPDGAPLGDAQSRSGILALFLLTLWMVECVNRQF